MKLSDYEALKWFDAHEFEEPLQMDLRFLRRLDLARELAQVPFVISSSFREDPKSSHGLGLAVDLSLPKDGHCRERARIVDSAYRVGITRRGIYDFHVHLDCGDLVDPLRFPPECLWWGESK